MRTWTGRTLACCALLGLVTGTAAGACGQPDCPAVSAPACYATEAAEQFGYPVPTPVDHVVDGCSSPTCECDSGERYAEKHDGALSFVACIPQACPEVPAAGNAGWAAAVDGCPESFDATP